MKAKKKTAKKKGKRTTTDVGTRRKYARGGRIEAYTMGEAAGSKRWP